MMTDGSGHVEQMTIRTEVPGLDEILCGGLLEGGLYLVEGPPGAGKTILSSHIAFNWIRRERRVLFITLIAESHGKLVNHLRPLSFFDEREVAEHIFYVSLFSCLLNGGLSELSKELIALVRKHKPALLVIDGFRTARDLAGTQSQLSRFIHDLNSFVTTARCTTLILSPDRGGDPHPEHTLVDGLLELSRPSFGPRTAREIEVYKMRGARHLEGKHNFCIGADGIIVFPRLEATVSRSPPTVPLATDRLRMGNAELDEMLGGGLPGGSTTCLLGSPGAGKTLTGVQFLAQGLREGGTAVYFGFYESPQRLVGKARALGIELQRFVDDGRLEIVWQPTSENLLDELAYKLLHAVDRLKAQRIFIDGLEGFRDSAIRPERIGRFTVALTTLLRARGVTTVFTEEADAFSSEIRAPITRVSAVIENIIVLRHVEVAGSLRRVIAIMKMRDSAYDSSLRELLINSSGIHVGATFTAIQSVMSGGGFFAETPNSKRQKSKRARATSTSKRKR